MTVFEFLLYAYITPAIVVWLWNIPIDDSIQKLCYIFLPLGNVLFAVMTPVLIYMKKFPKPYRGPMPWVLIKIFISWIHKYKIEII